MLIEDNSKVENTLYVAGQNHDRGWGKVKKYLAI